MKHVEVKRWVTDALVFRARVDEGLMSYEVREVLDDPQSWRPCSPAHLCAAAQEWVETLHTSLSVHVAAMHTHFEDDGMTSTAITPPELLPMNGGCDAARV